VKLLVDTHLILWAASAPKRLSKKARALLSNPDNILHFSAAALWELVIKSTLGREDFIVDVVALRRGLLLGGWRELGISGEHVLAVAGLAPLHRDPFDRIMIAQARLESMPLLTRDAQMIAYGAPVQAV
jgi:PIN domain nuclease of toxin-antitoxin system